MADLKKRLQKRAINLIIKEIPNQLIVLSGGRFGCHFLISFNVLEGNSYYELYFGEQPNPDNQLTSFSFVDNPNSFTFEEPLEYYQDYYWKVVLYDANYEMTTLNYAFKTRPPLEGLGTEENPYQIADMNDLITITEYQTLWDNHYIQTTNIDASSTLTMDEGRGFNPIGLSNSPFTGSFDGNGFTISNLYINRTNLIGVGFFGKIEEANISNVSLTDSDIIGNGTVGILVGDSDNMSIISNCYVTGSASGSGSNIGAIVGYAVNSIITNSYAICSVSGEERVGGLVGYSSDLTINNCFAKGSVSGIGNYLGGLVGYTNDSNINNSFATSSVYGTERYVAGLVGFLWGTIITNCYATGFVDSPGELGGLVASYYSNSEVNNSFWDIETTGQTSSVSGTGKTTQEMRNIYTFLNAGWDFLPENANGQEDVWYIHPNYNLGYPFFTYEQLEKPLHAINYYPHHEMDDVATGDNLHWEDDYLENTSGYFVCLGTDNPPTNYLDNYDLGLTTFFEYNNLEANTTYYWQVIPYNENGVAEDCQIWSFTTGTENIISVGIGENTNDQLPINYENNRSYSQSVYLQSELNMNNREIEKLSFYLNKDSNMIGAKQIKVFLGHTDKTHFENNNDWMLTNQGLTEVVNVMLNDTLSAGWVEIELTTPFDYNNVDNLIVGVMECSASLSVSPNNNFYTIETGSNRTLSFSHDTIIIDTIFPYVADIKTSIPKIKFTFSEPNTTFSGLVKNSSGIPISNSTIEIENIANIQSNENGLFEVVDILPGSYQIEVSALWYETQSLDFQIIEGQANYLEIILLEDLLPAANVQAFLAEDLTNVQITWGQPILARENNSSKQVKSRSNLLKKHEIEQRTDQLQLVYNLYRYLAEDEANPENWIQVATNLDALTYSDTSFPSLDLGSYYWAVQAVYSNDRLAEASISNEILKQPNIASNIEAELDFGTIYLTNASEYQEVIITNIGTGPLTIDEITSTETAFNLLYDSADFIIEPGSSMTLQVNFAPDNPGSYVGDLIIANNSSNEPNYTLTLRGFCQYIPPADPEGVQVTLVNNTAQISWEPVTEDVYENPISPDLYIIYFNGLNTQDDNHFYYLGTTNQLSYDHINVGAFSEFMFYRVKAYVDVDNAVLSHINDLVSQKRKVSLKEVESLISNRKGKAILKD